MAYIDLETERADYRLLLGQHDRSTDATLLPKNCTGIVLEGLFVKPEHFYLSVTDTEKVPIQDRHIIQFAKKKGIPLIAAEHIRRENFYLSSPFKDPLLLITMFPLWAEWSNLTRSSKGIDTKGFRFRVVDRVMFLAEKLSDYTKTTFNCYGTLRNLVFAQSADTFANLQLESGVPRPSLAILAGAQHIGVRRALRMNLDERVEKISQNPYSHLFYGRDRLHEGYYLQYNCKTEDWERGEFEEPKLKVG